MWYHRSNISPVTDGIWNFDDVMQRPGLPKLADLFPGVSGEVVPKTNIA